MQKDGLTFEGFLFVDGQAGSEMSPVCRTIRASDLLSRDRDLGYWAEGTLSASGLKHLIVVRSAIQRLRRVVKSALRLSRSNESNPQK
jgi:hypothetical protein